MANVEELPDDEKEHGTHDDRVVNGVIAYPSDTDHVVWQEGERRITLVTGDSTIAQRKTAEDLCSVANLETCWNGGIYHATEPPDERNIHLFLYHAGIRVVGAIVLERRCNIWRCRWRNDGPPECEELHDHGPIWSVVFVWALKKLRRQAIARKLFTEAARFLNIGQEALGWYTPFSADGRAFVKSLYPDEFIVAK